MIQKKAKTTPNISCINCGSSSVFYFTKKNENNEFRIFRCPSCKSAFVWPRIDTQEIKEYYFKDTYSDFTIDQIFQLNSRYYPDSFTDSNRIIDNCWSFKRGYNFLDVGAGFGPFSRAALKKGFHVSACEPNPNARNVFLKVSGFEPDACIFDREYASRHEEKYDVVLLSQVLEHVVDPNEVARNIYAVLRENGLAAIAVPHFGSALSKIQGKNDMYISPPEHLTYFSKQGLIKLFQRYDFKIDVFETVTKVNKGRIEDTIPNSTLSRMTWKGLYFFLKIFERIDMGMIINAYFRKES